MKKVIGIIAVLLLLLSIIGMCTNSNEHIDDDTNNMEENNIEIPYDDEKENITQEQENINGGTTETGSEDTERKDDNVCLHSNTVIKNSSDATCTENGYSGDTYCKTCNTLVKAGASIKATSHKTEVKNQKEATTTSEGYTGDTYCKTCGEKLKSGETIPKIKNTTDTDSEIVYITETGKKYHSTKSCSGLSRAKAIYESSLSHAKSLGLDPCSKCY